MANRRDGESARAHFFQRQVHMSEWKDSMSSKNEERVLDLLNTMGYTKLIMNKYIPVYEYAKKYGIREQNVYRWIREGKLKDVKREERIVHRILVKDVPHA